MTTHPPLALFCMVSACLIALATVLYAALPAYKAKRSLQRRLREHNLAVERLWRHQQGLVTRFEARAKELGFTPTLRVEYAVLKYSPFVDIYDRAHNALYCAMVSPETTTSALIRQLVGIKADFQVEADAARLASVVTALSERAAASEVERSECAEVVDVLCSLIVSESMAFARCGSVPPQQIVDGLQAACRIKMSTDDYDTLVMTMRMLGIEPNGADHERG